MDRQIYDAVHEDFVPPRSTESGETVVDLRSLALGRMPKAVSAGMDRFMQLWREDSLSAWWKEWWDLSQTLADQHVAPLLNAGRGQTILVPSVTHVLHQLFSSPEVNKLGKRKVIVTDREFPTVYDVIHNENQRYANFPPEIQEQLKFQMQMVTMGDQGLNADKIIAAIDDSTAVVVIPHVASFTGEIFSQEDIHRIVEKADQHDALVVVDGSQAIGSVRIDVQTMHPHIYTGTLLKQGAGAMNGYLYVRPDVKLDPTNGGWVGVADPFTHDDGSKRRSQNPSIPRRFAGIGTPQIAPLYHATQGLEIFNRIGHEAVVADIRAKATWIIDQFRAAEIPLVSPADEVRASALIVLRALNAVQVRDDLEEEGVLVTGQEDIVRLAPHIYHSPDEIQRAVAKIIARFKFN